MHAPQVPATIRTEYRADIDGLCAVAVLSTAIPPERTWLWRWIRRRLFRDIGLPHHQIDQGWHRGRLVHAVGVLCPASAPTVARAVRDAGCGSCLAIA